MNQICNLNQTPPGQQLFTPEAILDELNFNQVDISQRPPSRQKDPNLALSIGSGQPDRDFVPPMSFTEGAASTFPSLPKEKNELAEEL